ncbi:MAG: hypothetical protein AAF657_24725, partial [Acidobacteriota bacterium]
LVVPGMGHGVLERGCMPKLVTEFLAEPDPAGLDATCIEKVEPLPIFLSFTGPVLPAKSGDDPGAAAQSEVAQSEAIQPGEDAP